MMEFKIQMYFLSKVLNAVAEVFIYQDGQSI